MPQGGELALSLFKLDAVCQITVADTGIGMSEAQLSSIFAPFFTTKKAGNGLGLVEAKKIIQAHGGSIDVRSMLARGTTFVLTLPIKKGL
jgi:signal transduction histidine kinase